MERIKQAVERARAERSQGVAAAALEQPQPVGQTRAPGAARRLKLTPRPVKISWPVLYRNRVVGGPDGDTLIDSYRILRTRVMQRLAEYGGRTLGITSANAGEGKSLTSVNLAISMARKTPVLLVDADLRRPAQRRLFGIEPSAGLADIITGDAMIEDCVLDPGIEGLAILPGGAPTRNSSELLGSAIMLELVESLKQSDPGLLIVFDLTPLLTTDDALAFAPHLDAVLMVAEEGRTRPGDLERATELLKQARFLGTVLNKSTQPHQSYY